MWLDRHPVEVNEDQYSFLQIVGKQLLAEVQQNAPGTTAKTEPMRRLLHGKPGTGKSFVIKKVCQLLEEVAGFKKGTHYELAALQATMAVQIGGDTLHHILHIRGHSGAGPWGKATPRV